MTNTQTQTEEITLTLDPTESDVSENNLATEAQEPVKDIINDSGFSDAEKRTMENFSQQINVADSDAVLKYGSLAQKKVSDFSDKALGNIRTKDIGEVGTLLSDLVIELKSYDATPTEKKGFFSSIFNKGQDAATKFKTKYDTVSANVDKVADMLEEQQITLLKDIDTLDQLYEKNALNTKELTMYILAGKKKLAEVRTTELPALIEKAKKSGLPEDTLAANDLDQACVRFEKKLYDLELTRQISVQMAPQIRLIQNNDTMMTEKIQSTIANTIPLWKNQIVLSLGIQHSKEAMEAQRAVTDMTNTLLKQNAETLHQATVETAKESERGIVDIETLQHTNKELIATLEEVQQIQREGREKRAEAEKELSRIETELNAKLLQINSSTPASTRYAQL